MASNQEITVCLDDGCIPFHSPRLLLAGFWTYGCWVKIIITMIEIIKKRNNNPECCSKEAGKPVSDVSHEFVS